MPLYDEADALVRSGDPARAEIGIALLRQHAKSHSDEAEAWYRYGSALDFSGREAEAIVAYDRVFALGLDGLPPELRYQLYVQAGSTLRNLARLDEARALLERGQREYPQARAIAAFLALVEVSAGNERRAIELLFDVILGEGGDDESIVKFSRALRYYAEELPSA